MGNEEEMDLMAIRAKNMAELNNMFGSIFSEAEQINKEVEKLGEDIRGGFQEPRKRKRQRSDEIFRFTGIIPLERRKSERLSNVKPKYSYTDSEKIEGFEDFDKRDKDPDFYLEGLEDIIREPGTKRRKTTHRATISVPIRMPEEITERELNNIATKSGNKTYSQNGTSCHQCRQKTIDTKTVCRSRRCIGVRGQFCGPCLKNRYGESARDALLDPEWACPPCRDLCNCSICRTRDGKRPTGILAPTVQQEGYASVKDFLLNLAEKGILSKEYKQPVDDVLAAEQTESVIDALIKSYVKKICEKHSKYEIPKSNELAQLIGFQSGYPVHLFTDDAFEGDVLGFTDDKKYCCILSDNIVYLHDLC